MLEELTKNLYVADVIENDDTRHPTDPDEQSRVKIKVAEFMSGFKDEHLPWARPWNLSTGGSKTHGKTYIPEIGSKVWVFFENSAMKKHAFYIADTSLANFNPAKFFKDTVNDNLNSEHIDGTLEYPNVKFEVFANGICQFVCSSTDNPFWGVYHPTGAQIVINKAGEVFVGGKDGQVDPVVSTLKLKNYLATIKGNLGSFLFTDVFAADISFKDFNGAVDSSLSPSPAPLLGVPLPAGSVARQTVLQESSYPLAADDPAVDDLLPTIIEGSEEAEEYSQA